RSGWAGASECVQLPDGVEPPARKWRSEAWFGEGEAVLYHGGGVVHSRFAWLVGLLRTCSPCHSPEHAGSSTKDRHHADGRNTAGSIEKGSRVPGYRRRSTHRRD